MDKDSVVLVLTLLLTMCSLTFGVDSRADDHLITGNGQVHQKNEVLTGTIISIRPITTQTVPMSVSGGNQSGIGGFLGFGSNFNQQVTSYTTVVRFEIAVNLDNGSLLILNQTNLDGLKQGDRVRVLGQSGGNKI